MGIPVKVYKISPYHPYLSYSILYDYLNVASDISHQPISV